MAATRVAIATMKVAQIPKPGADFQIVEREIPQPSPGHVRIKVQACGVWDGTAATTAPAGSAGVEIFAIAGISRLPASAVTADTRNTWWPRWRPWWRCRTV